VTLSTRDKQTLLRQMSENAQKYLAQRDERRRVAREAEVAKRNTVLRRALRGGRRFVPPPDPRWPYDPYDCFDPKWPYGPY